MSQIPKIDTALRDFEDAIEGASPSKIYKLIDKLRSNIDKALDELLVENAHRFVTSPEDELWNQENADLYERDFMGTKTAIESKTSNV